MNSDRSWRLIFNTNFICVELKQLHEKLDYLELHMTFFASFSFMTLGLSTLKSLLNQASKSHQLNEQFHRSYDILGKLRYNTSRGRIVPLIWCALELSEINIFNKLSGMRISEAAQPVLMVHRDNSKILMTTIALNC